MSPPPHTRERRPLAGAADGSAGRRLRAGQDSRRSRDGLESSVRIARDAALLNWIGGHRYGVELDKWSLATLRDRGYSKAEVLVAIDRLAAAEMVTVRPHPRGTLLVRET